MPARRVSYPRNPLLQFWDPCVDHTRQFALPDWYMGDAIHASPPPDWPNCMVRLIDRICQTSVGRGLVRHLRRRTTIYYVPGAAAAEYDTFGLEDRGGRTPDAARRLIAQERAVEAVIFIDPLAPSRNNHRGLLKGPDISLAHELAHALGMTHGLQPRDGPPGFMQTYDAPSQEEGHGLVIENMYRSELRLPLRRTYMDDAPVWEASGQPPMQSVLAVRTVRNYQRLVASFATEMERLSPFSTPYNPFRDYRRGAHLAPRVSPRTRRRVAR